VIRTAKFPSQEPQQRHSDQVSFALRTSPWACTLKLAMDTIKDAFRQVGEPDPFAPAATEGKTRNRAPSMTIPSLSGIQQFGHVPQGVAVHSVMMNSLTAMERPTTSAGTPEQLQQMWEFFRRQTRYQQQVLTRRRRHVTPTWHKHHDLSEVYDSSHVTCFRCGTQSPNGHYVHECDPVSIPMPAWQQREVREQVLGSQVKRRNHHNSTQYPVGSGPNAEFQV
jgi:hypothetical protein